MKSSIKNLFETEFGLDAETMPIGKPINVYESGIALKGYNKTSDKVEYGRVRFAIKKPKGKMISIKTESRSLNAVSAKHLFATIPSEDAPSVDWTIGEDLKVGTYLIDENWNKSRILEISPAEDDYVYDVETELGNYFSDGILGHNTPMSHLPASSGGMALPFYCSIICRITKTDDIKDANGVIGSEIRVRNMKNKCSIPFRDANMKLYYNGGFKSDEEYVDFLLSLGYMVQKGAYFQFDYGGEHFSLQGRQKLMDWLTEHADVYEKWKKEIKAKLSGYVEELDSDNYAVNEETGEALNAIDAEKAAAYAKQTTGAAPAEEIESKAESND